MEETSGRLRSPRTKEFVQRECAEVIGRHVPPLPQPQDVVLYGFGRIGRLLARLLVEKTGSGEQLRLRAIVVRKGSEDDLVKRASLLRRDSVHGSFQGTLRVDEENELHHRQRQRHSVIYASAVRRKWTTKATAFKNAIVIDNTGAWRDEAGLGEHLKSKGAAKVILTAPRQRRDQEHCLRCELQKTSARRQHSGCGQLHHQRHCAGAEGHERRVRYRMATWKPYTRTPTTRT